MVSRVAASRLLASAVASTSASGSATAAAAAAQQTLLRRQLSSSTKNVRKTGFQAASALQGTAKRFAHSGETNEYMVSHGWAVLPCCCWLGSGPRPSLASFPETKECRRAGSPMAQHSSAVECLESYR